ncbi:Uncharacterised protein [Legionella lansingensis]|uniref:Uncharacterized protein n=1 Tax=Legionella lansingensis TaxID=45067 RepID=A0A0W0VQ83_9GAMM|nr:hypothetical protein [Legionella lansingensis]KTD22268.1 hypothetical protein Llan_1209 [Legionella lansingensis]SNV50598.1 Uncharacterised protein [Legionella lansingensis]
MEKKGKNHPEIKNIKNICDVTPKSKEAKDVCDVIHGAKKKPSSKKNQKPDA